MNFLSAAIRAEGSVRAETLSHSVISSSFFETLLCGGVAEDFAGAGFAFGAAGRGFGVWPIAGMSNRKNAAVKVKDLIKHLEGITKSIAYCLCPDCAVSSNST